VERQRQQQQQQQQASFVRSDGWVGANTDCKTRSISKKKERALDRSSRCRCLHSDDARRISN